MNVDIYGRVAVRSNAAHPRGIGFKRSAEFQEMYSTLWDALS